MTALEKTEYDVLNVVALKKMASAPAIAHATGFDAERIEAVLTGLADHGLVYVADGSALPTDQAEPALADAASTHYALVRTDAVVTDLATRFEVVNTQFLTTMSAWQQIDVGGHKVANDHQDLAYDDKVITRLERLVDRLGPLLDALAEHDSRFASYAERFGVAQRAIDSGRHELVSSPVADSLHTIWFEFHEDLLRTLGKARKE